MSAAVPCPADPCGPTFTCSFHRAVPVAPEQYDRLPAVWTLLGSAVHGHRACMHVTSSTEMATVFAGCPELGMQCGECSVAHASECDRCSNLKCVQCLLPAQACPVLYLGPIPPHKVTTEGAMSYFCGTICFPIPLCQEHHRF